MLGIASGLMLANKISEPATMQQFGEALRCSGQNLDQQKSNGYVGINNDFKTTIRANSTIAFWVKHSDGRDSEGNGQVYFSIGIGNNSATSSDDEYTVQENGGSGKIQFNLRANGDAHMNITDAAHIADGAASDWQHIAVTVTKNSSGNTTSIVYVDGVAVDTSIASSLEITDTNHNTFEANTNYGTNIGATSGRTTTGTGVSELGLFGDIKEVALWNVALDAAAIAKIYGLGDGKGILPNPNLLVDDGDYDVSGNLVGYWKLDDYSGQTAVDSKGSNDGTIYFDSATILITGNPFPFFV